MKGKRAAFLFGACAAALLGIIGLLAAVAVFRPRTILPLAERWLAPAGGSATVSDLTIGLFPPVLSLSGVVVSGPPEKGEILRLSALRIEGNGEGIPGDRPWLRLVKAEGVSYERTQPGREPTGGLDLSPLEWLFRIERLAIANARVRIAFPWGVLAAEGVDLEFSPGKGGTRDLRGTGEISASRDGSLLGAASLEAHGEARPGPAIEAGIAVRRARLDLPWIGGEVLGNASLVMTGDGVRVEQLSVNMPGARLGGDVRKIRGAVPVRLDAEGSVSLDGGNPSLAVRALEIGDLLRARGRMSGPAPGSMTGFAEGEVHAIERMETIFPEGSRGRLEGVDLKGDLAFRAEVSARKSERVLTLELLPRGVLASLPREGLSCRLEGGAVMAAGSMEEWQSGRAVLAGNLRGTGRLRRPPWGIRGLRLEVPLGGYLFSPSFPGWRILAGEGAVSYGGRALPLGTLDVRGSAAGDDGSVRLEDLDVRSGALGRLTGRMAIRGGGLDGRLGGRNLKVRPIPGIAGALSAGSWGDWASEGTIDLDVRLVPDGGGTRVAVEAAMGRIGFGSPAGDLIGQNLGGRLTISGGTGSRSRVSAGLDITGGEVLRDTVYVDLARAPLSLSSRFTRAGAGRYEDIVLEADWADFGSVRVDRGSLQEERGWSYRGTLLLRQENLAAAFRTFVREPLASSHPALAGLSMEGSARLSLSFSGAEGRTDLSGRLALRVEDLRREGEAPVLSGLRVDLPVAYALGRVDPGMPSPQEDSGWGRLRLESVRLADTVIGPLEAPVALVPNRLHVRGGFEASLLGASVSLRGIRVEDPLSRSFRANLSVRVEGLELSRLSGERIALAGSLGGTLDPVSIGLESVRSEGALRGDLFGGRMEIDNVALDRPFGSGREIGADVNFDRIDLERLSDALGIGRITGRLSGSAKDLWVAYGQPVAFELLMRSVPEKGVRQLVSLKAVNSISLVSTGTGLTGLGYSLMTTFFREFPYEKIGIACSLRNDVFTVRGLIHEEGVEYLVKKPFLAGINVINRTPDNRIGFSDMVERLKRITAGDTLEEDGRNLSGAAVAAAAAPPEGLPGREDQGRSDPMRGFEP